MVTASYIPLLAVILAHLLGASLSAAANVGLTVAIVLLMIYAWSAGRAAQLRAGSCSQITFRWTWSGTCPRNRRVLLDAVQERRG